MKFSPAVQQAQNTIAVFHAVDSFLGTAEWIPLRVDNVDRVPRLNKARKRKAPDVPDVPLISNTDDGSQLARTEHGTVPILEDNELLAFIEEQM